jgi:4-hydroxybenzoate polyprenyltransferase
MDFTNGFTFKPAIYIILILLFIGLASITYFSNKKLMLTIVKDMRWLRLIHYAFMIVLGCVLALKSHSIPRNLVYANIYTLPLAKLILCFISVLFAGLFAIVNNNIADQNIDKVSNQTRPLITGAISLQHYQQIGNFAFIMALLYACVVSIPTLISVCLVMLVYYIYSTPPLRLKRVPIFSKLAISFNSLIMIILGYLLINSNLSSFPWQIAPIFLLGFTLAANFIDIKDYAGDKQEGILTLPVLLGMKRAKIWIGLAFIVTYLSFIVLLPELKMVWLLLGGGLTQFYLINKKNYQEKHIFWFHLASIFILAIVLV